MDKPLRILILEDNPTDADIIKFELEEAGFALSANVVSEKNQFIKALHEFPDLILSDYDLPRYNGALALADAKMLCPEVPFILVTGAVSEDRAIEVLTSGAKDYVMKNRISRLAPAVKRVLAEAKEHKARKNAEEELRKAHAELEVKVKERTAALEAKIKEHKRTELALRESEERFRAAFEDSNIAMTITALDGKFLKVNSAFARLLKIPEVDLIGQHFAKYTHPDDLAVNLPGIESLSTGKLRTFRMEKRYIVNGGQVIWVDMSTSSVCDSQGKPLYLVTHIQDINENKLSEGALRDSEERYRSVVENTTAIILRITPSGIINFANTRALEFFGYSAEELIGKPAVGTVVPPMESSGRDLKKMMAQIGINPNAFHKNANENMCKDGRRVWLEWTNAGIYGTDGKLSEFLSVGIDVTARKLAEENFTRTSRILSDVLESIEDGFFALDRNWIFTYVNELASKNIGLTSKNLINCNLWEKIPAIIGTPLEASFRNAMEKRETQRFEMKGNLTDKFYFISVYPSEDGISVYWQDITTRKQTEEAMKEFNRKVTEAVETERNRLFTMLDTLPIMISLLTPDHQVAFSNQAFRTKFGEANGRHCYEYYCGYKAPCEFCESFKPLETGQPHHWELIPPDGSTIDVYNFPFTDLDGSPMILAMEIDITERKHIEENLIKESAKSEYNQLVLESIIRQMPVGVIITDASGMTAKNNEAMDRIWRRKMLSSENIENHGYIAYHKDGREYKQEEWPLTKALLEGEIIVGEEMVILRGDGTKGIVHASSAPIKDKTGKIIAGVALGIDITELKQAEIDLKIKASQLEDANNELESFSYSVSHDLRAPLRTIDGYSRMILKRNGNEFDEETKRQFNQVRKSTKTMGQLIDDLLVLSRSGRQDLMIKSLNIRRIIKKAWEELQNGNPDRNMTLKINQSLPLGFGDEGLIQQVIINLLSNAVKFTKTRDAALIEAGGYEHDRELIYYIKDNGVGFDMQYHDKLFGTFQRLHDANEYEGTGVGMALVKRIIHRHGGQVWAEGEIDKGATFYFTLRRQHENDYHPSEPSS